MNNAIVNTLIFSLGAAAGSLVTWRILKTKYEQKTQDEIDAYKRHVKAKNSNESTEEKKENEGTDEATEEVEEEDESAVPKDLLDRYRSDEYEKEDNKAVRAPYVISPDEYDTVDGYECVSLTYYADDVLTDEWDNVIQDVDDIVGEDFASHFGEYENDSVFIRNEAEQRDYEILRDLNTFADTMGMEA